METKRKWILYSYSCKYEMVELYATIDLMVNSAIDGASPGSGVTPQRRSYNMYRKRQ
ncbi:MAG: hypothetical protein OIN87_00505 [Candidatus Methanoperedens sp.]|nr:hypothetical protein [Candidatus Methanoperedens sp.]